LQQAKQKIIGGILVFADSQTNKYTAETTTVPFQGKLIQFTNCTPILTPEQREKRKKEIESVLYNIFKKYAV